MRGESWHDLILFGQWSIVYVMQAAPALTCPFPIWEQTYKFSALNIVLPFYYCFYHTFLSLSKVFADPGGQLSDGEGIAVEQANFAVFPYGKTGGRRVCDRKLNTY